MNGKAMVKLAISVTREIVDALEKELMSKNKLKEKVNVKKKKMSSLARSNNHNS